MIVTQRGSLENPFDYSHFTAEGPAQTLRFTAENPDDPNTPDRWKREPEEYAIGNDKDNHASSGGLALQYAYKDDGSIDLGSCGGTIIVSADALGAKADAHGLQLNAIGLVRPANVPPNQSTIINLVPGENDVATRGYAGGVAALQDCGGSGFPPVAGGPGEFPPVAGGGMPPVAGGGGAGGSTFPPVEDTQLGGGGTTTDKGTKGGGGTTTNGALQMTKVPGSVTCAENQSCAFKITVKNGSDKPVDKVVISDNPSIGGAPFTKFKLGNVAAPWVCVASAAPGMECTHPPLKPNELADLTLGFTPDPGSLAGATEFNNCVSFADGKGAVANNAPQQAALPPPTTTNSGGLKVETIGTSPHARPQPATASLRSKLRTRPGRRSPTSLSKYSTRWRSARRHKRKTAPRACSCQRDFSASPKVENSIVLRTS